MIPLATLIPLLTAFGPPVLGKLFGGSGREEGYKNVPTRSPEQEALVNSLMPYIQQGFQNPYEGFEGIENKTRSDFNKKTIPGIAEMFTGMKNSSSYGNAMNEAATDLDTNLAALRSQYGMNRQGMLAGMLPQLLSPGFQPAYQERQPSGFASGMTSGFGNLMDYLNRQQLQNRQDYWNQQQLDTNKEQLNSNSEWLKILAQQGAGGNILTNTSTYNKPINNQPGYNTGQQGFEWFGGQGNFRPPKAASSAFAGLPFWLGR